MSFTGVISLPYAEIKEPFEAWFDTAGKSSRIDYYYGKNTMQNSISPNISLWELKPLSQTLTERLLVELNEKNKLNNE